MFYAPVRRLGAGEPMKNIIGCGPPAPGADYSEKTQYYICTFENREYGSRSNSCLFGNYISKTILFLRLWMMCSFLLLMGKGKIIVTCSRAGALHVSLLAL